MLPLQRFLPPVYEDGIQSIRRSLFNRKLPSARSVSTRVHRDKNREIQSVTLMFMQWGQFIDHDITSIVKSRSFNGSIPRCCDRGGRGFLPPHLMHPTCLPIEVADDDWFLSRFGIRCMEFLRSAPSTRIDCDLGWREQINQVTPFIDASTIYGSDIETSDSIRTFRNGKLIYGRPQNQGPLNPPDPPGGELCRAGAITSDCYQPGDGRSDEQPGLISMHTVWIRYHNKLATVLSKLNSHWSDEKVFQETRKIVYSIVQHITYREFLPIVLGQEVMELFELNLERKGYYNGYDSRVNPQMANSFVAAAYRFGHSMVPNSYVRADSQHRPIFNNVSLHEDIDNSENIWSFGSVDRLILGFLNHASQRRDEFLCEELTNHLFQFDTPFGMDLAAINIQRGRDHGLPPYIDWREPCGLTGVRTWKDLEDIMSLETTQRLRSLYEHVGDIDLYTGGLAEKPLRGGVVGPTFACIIAQQFVNLRKGDRFWYENGKFESSFTPAQLQQIRHVTLAQVLCQTMDDIETIQPFVFLSHDNFRNVRLPCNSPLINNFDLSPWGERDFKEIDDKLDSFETDEIDNDVEGRGGTKKDNCDKTKNKRRKTQTNTGTNANRLGSLIRPPLTNADSTSKPVTAALSQNIRTTTKRKTKRTEPPLKIPIINITSSSIIVEDKYGFNDNIVQRPNLNTYGIPDPYYDNDKTDVTYLFGVVSEKTTPIPTKTERPLELNIKIQYFLPSTTTAKPTKKKRTKRPTYVQSHRPSNDIPYPIFIQQDSYHKPSPSFHHQTTSKPLTVFNRPTNYDHNRPSNIYNTDEYHRPQSHPSSQSDIYQEHFNRPQNSYHRPTESFNIYDSDYLQTTTRRNYNIRPTSYYDNYPYQSQYDENPLYTTKKTYKPTQRPQYNNIYEYDKNTYVYGQPIHIDTHRDDPISDVYAQLFNEGQTNIHIPMKPTFGQIDDKIQSYRPTYHQPNKIYSLSHVQNLDDKLDFKSKFVFDKRGSTTDELDYDDDDRRFIKISSVKSDDIISTNKNKFINTVQSKEGDLDLSDNAKLVRSENHKHRLRLVEIEVTPSEMRKDQWAIFNATDEVVPLLVLPDINQNISCSEELPKPIKIKNTNKKKGRRHA